VHNVEHFLKDFHFACDAVVYGSGFEFPFKVICLLLFGVLFVCACTEYVLVTKKTYFARLNSCICHFALAGEQTSLLL
jgi:hypothetical protein